MTNKFYFFRSFAPENGSGMDRLCIGTTTMKSRKLLSLLFVLLLGIGNVWGAQSSVTWSTGSYSSSTITWSTANICTIYQEQNGAQTAPSSSYVSAPRWYTGNKITITAGSGVSTFTSIVITATSNSYGSTLANSTYTVTGGTGSVSASNSNGTVTISMTGTVTAFTIVMSGQSRLSNSANPTINYTAPAPSCNPLTMSTVTATSGNAQIALSWPAVANASSYTVSCKVKSSGASAGTVGGVTGTTTKSCTITGLANGTEYTWSVMPVGTGSYCAENTPATGDATPNVSRTITYYDKDGQHTTSLTDGTNIATALNALYGVGGPTSCNTTDYNYFVGWKDGEISGTATSVTLLSTEVVNATTAAKSYYAVWSDKDPSSGSWAQATSISVDDEIVFVYTSGKRELTGIASSIGTASTYTTNPGYTYILTVKAGSANNSYAFKNGNNYLSWSSGNSLTTSTSINDASSWTINTSTNGNFKFANVGTTDRLLQYNKNSGQERWACYTSNQTEFQIYKRSAVSANYITTCCTELGQINGSVNLSQLTEGVNAGKLQATWDEQTSTNGWANPGIVIKIYEDGNATPVVTSDALANNTTSFTATDFTPKTCTQYYATLTATHGGSSTYCAGDLVSDASEKVTTAGYTITYNLTDDHVTKKSGDAYTSSCSGDIDAYYEAVSGYVLPKSITVTNAGDENDNWSWNSSTGELMILAEGITGNVVVTITADAAPCDPMSNPSVSVEKSYSGATLSWSAISHAAKYKVYIYNNDDSDLESNENVTGTSYAVSAALTNLTTYKYRVDAVSENETNYCSSYATGSFTTLDFPTVKLYYSENGTVSEGVDQKILTDFTLPNTAAECSKTFIGWTTLSLYSHASAAPDPFIEKGTTWQIPTNEKCTLYAVYADVTAASLTWDATAIGSIGTSDVFVIVGNNGSTYAMPNDGGASAPTAASVTVSGTQITSTVAANLQWNIAGNSTDGYTFYPNGSTTTWLYLLDDSNNGVRIGGGSGSERKVFTIEDGYLYTTQTKSGRYVGIYNSTDWRCYTNTTGNIADQTFTFYKKNEVAASTTNYSLTCQGKVAKPVISGVTGSTTYEEDQTVTITSATAGATIKYTTDGSDPASSATAATMATGSSFTLSVNGTYNIRAIAVKADMTNSDEATQISNVTIDKPYTTIADFIEGAPATAKKLVFTAESNAVVLGVNSSRIYIQDPTGGIYLYKSSHGKSWAKGKKVVGTLTGSYELNTNTPRMNVTDFGETVATADGTIPDAVVIDGAIDADIFAANRNTLVTVSGLNFQAESVGDGASINITRGNDTYNIYNAFNALTSHVLPLSATDCSVTGILGYYNNKYQLMPIDANCIVTNADAVLPTLEGEFGGVDEEHATEVASGEKIELTAASGYTTTYKIGTGSENAVSTSGTEVTISGSNNDVVVITVKATREYYEDNSKAYYYKINNALTKYTITASDASNGSFAVKNSGGSEITSSVAGATITLAATADDNYHFVSWAISNASTQADVTSSVSLSSSTNKDATFTMPEFDVKISATFAENPYATVTFVKGADAATGTAPDNQKVYVGQNATMPANPFTYSNHSFAGWELNSTTYQPGDTYEVTAAGTITFSAKWREKDINKDGQWELVTDVNELNAGDFVVIAQKEQGKTESATIGGSTNKYLTGVATTFTGTNSEYITKENLNATTAVKYVLGGTSGAWTLTDDATGKMLQQTGNPSWVTENGSVWNIVITNGNAYLYPGANNTTSRILYNTSGGFRAYSSATSASMLLPQLYKFYRSAFVVSYDANGGEGAPDSQRADPDNGQVTISATEPTREGYTFTGWEDGNGNAKSGTITLTESITLYAQWTPTPYNAAVTSVDNVTITATPAEASAITEGNNANVPFGTEVTLSYTGLVSTHMFNGWVVTKADDAETMVTVNNNKFSMPAYAVTISANVEEKAAVQLHLTYNKGSEGATGTMDGNPFTYNFEDEVTVAANPFSYPSHIFRGWKDQDDKVYKAGDRFNIVKDMTLTAQWRTNGAGYTITSNSAVSSPDDKPEGSTATYSQTYSGTSGQMTTGNSTTLTLTGYQGKLLKSLTLSMKSNKSTGAGSMTVKVGSTTIIDLPATDFNQWFDNTSYSQSYVDVHVTPFPETYVADGKNIEIKITGTTNSIYINSYTLTYANASVITTDATVSEETHETLVVENNADVTIGENVSIEELVVENGSSVEINTTTAEVENLVVKVGAKVKIKKDKKLTVDGFTIKSTMASGNSGRVDSATNVNFKVTDDTKVYYDLTLGAGGTNEQWHAFTVPFPVDVMNGIYDLDGNKLTNEVNYAIMEYHGDLRAQGQYGWKKIRTTLVPGTFYLMATDNRANYRLMKKAGEPVVAANSKSLSEYALDGGSTGDNGWNGVGNPTLSFGTVDYLVYVLDPSSYTYEYFEPGEKNFVVGTPFFIQATANATMVMDAENDSKPYYAPARDEKGIDKIKLFFGNEAYKDKLTILASEEALNDYKTGEDMLKMKMTETPSVAQISAKAYGVELCRIKAPMSNNQAVYDLSLYVPATGTYSISCEENENVNIYLTKNGAIIWNLTQNPYTVEMEQGATEGYGLMLVKRAPQDVETVSGDASEAGVQKVVINDKVFILRGEQLFGIDGKLVK